MGLGDLRRFGSGSQGRMGSSGMEYSRGICNVSTRDGLRSKANRRVGNKNWASLNYNKLIVTGKQIGRAHV